MTNTFQNWVRRDLAVLLIGSVWIIGWLTVTPTNVFAQTFSGEMQFVIDDREGAGMIWGDHHIFADGLIMEGTAKRLEEFLEKHPGSQAVPIFLNSSGGSVLEGIKVGRVIRRYRLLTMLGKYSDTQGFEDGVCYSACAYAFLGGQFRFMGEGDRFGIHQFHRPGTDLGSVSEVQSLSGLIVKYLVDMGVNPVFFSRATEALPGEMLMLTHQEMLEVGFVNNGRLPPTAEYTLQAGKPYLVIRLNSAWTPGRVTLSCSAAWGESGVGLAAGAIFIGPGTSAKLPSLVLRGDIEIDGVPVDRAIPFHPEFELSVSVVDVYVLYGKGVLERLKEAETLGVWLELADDYHPVGFELPIDSIRARVTEFVDNCSPAE